MTHVHNNSGAGTPVSLAIAAALLCCSPLVASAQGRHEPTYGAEPERNTYGSVLLSAGLAFDSLKDDASTLGFHATGGYALNPNLIVGVGLKQMQLLGDLQGSDSSAGGSGTQASLTAPLAMARAQVNLSGPTASTEFRFFAQGEAGPAVVQNADAMSGLRDAAGLHASIQGGLNLRRHRETSFHLGVGYGVWSLPSIAASGEEEMKAFSGLGVEFGVTFILF